MKKVLVIIIIINGIFLTFLLKFNFWLFDSMSRTFTPLSFATLELYGKILSGLGISWCCFGGVSTVISRRLINTLSFTVS